MSQKFGCNIVEWLGGAGAGQPVQVLEVPVPAGLIQAPSDAREVAAEF
ncbi:MAG: hypothetical protein WBM00_09220 [Solirubrobacterales bacterium]